MMSLEEECKKLKIEFVIFDRKLESIGKFEQKWPFYERSKPLGTRSVERRKTVEN